MIPLRSINIADDLSQSDEALSKFRPTQKALQVMRAICGLNGSRATHIVAPYGSGKSISALAGISILRGQPKIVQRLQGQINAVDAEFAHSLGHISGKGQVLLLHGACDDLTSLFYPPPPPPPPIFQPDWH